MGKGAERCEKIFIFSSFLKVDHEYLKHYAEFKE